MARHKDRGPYKIGNVSVITNTQNHKDRKNYYRDAVWKRNQARRMKGNVLGLGYKHTDQAKKRMSEALKGRVPGFLGKRHSDATKRRMRQNWKNQFSEGAS